MKKKYIGVPILPFIFILGFIVVSAFAGAESGTSNFIPVPEPASILLLGVGLVGLAGLGRKKTKK